MSGVIVYGIVSVVAFLIGVYVTRWIFGIEQILDALKLQNQQSLAQIRLLKKMLLIKGIPSKEIDSIMDNGNPKTD